MVTTVYLTDFTGRELIKTPAVLPRGRLCIAFEITVRRCGRERRTVELYGNIRRYVGLQAQCDTVGLLIHAARQIVGITAGATACPTYCKVFVFH